MWPNEQIYTEIMWISRRLLSDCMRCSGCLATNEKMVIIYGKQERLGKQWSWCIPNPVMTFNWRD
jgi:hypothetical protein